jgi:hypothetical protein
MEVVMKSKLFILSLSVLGMSFLSANGAEDAKIDKSSLATGAAVEVKAEPEVVAADAKKEVAAEKVAAEAKENKAPQDKKSCTGCK